MSEELSAQVGIATLALLAPLAMAAGTRAGVPPLLTAAWARKAAPRGMPGAAARRQQRGRRRVC
jgi:hypothetical protein